MGGGGADAPAARGAPTPPWRPWFRGEGGGGRGAGAARRGEEQGEGGGGGGGGGRGVGARGQVPLAIGGGLLGMLLFRVLTANARPELERLGLLRPEPAR